MPIINIFSVFTNMLVVKPSIEYDETIIVSLSMSDLLKQRLTVNFLK